METQYIKTYSHALGRDMECKVYGHAGRPVLFIPCQDGRFFDFENFNMTSTWSPWIESGQVMVLSIDTIDKETWSDTFGNAYHRIRRHEAWIRYIVDEAVPMIQTIAQEQTKNGVTARVEYVIVDQKQLNIFYTLRSQTYDRLEVYPYICALDGTALKGYSLGNGEFGVPNGELRSITADFMNSDMPDGLQLTLKVADFSQSASGLAEVYRDDRLEVIEHEDPAFLAEFTFDLRFDARFTTQGQSIPVGETFTLDGQAMTLRDAEIYPTHIRLNFDADETNNAWLVALDFYLENERGQRFDTVSNGISATGSAGSPMMDSYRCESDFFANSQHLTLHITGARWLDKDLERIKLDLDTVTADVLPEGVTFHQAERKENGYLLVFSAPQREGFSYSIWDSNWWDGAGEKHDIPYGSTSIGYEDAETGKYVTFEDRFVQQVPLLDCSGGAVYLQPNFSRVTVPDTPVSVTVR